MACAAAMLFILAMTAQRAANGGYDGLLALCPKTGVSASFAALDALDSASDTARDFLFAYENIAELDWETEHRRYAIQTVTVNSVYPYVTRYPVLAGSFFAPAEVTLNRAAAFAMFGCVDVVGRCMYLRGASYAVTGVIDDLSEQPRLYIPAACLYGVDGAALYADGLLAVLRDGTHVQSVMVALQEAGVTSENHDLYFLSEWVRTVRDKFSLGVGFVLIAVLGCVINRCGIQVQRERRRGVVMMGCCAVALALAAAVMRHALPMLLHWQEYPTFYPWVPPVFGGRLSALRTLCVVSDGCFIGVCVALVGWIVLRDKHALR